MRGTALALFTALQTADVQSMDRTSLGSAGRSLPGRAACSDSGALHQSG